MEIKSKYAYVPFFELPLEVLFLYWPGADSAMRELAGWSPTADEFTAALAYIWDGERFTPADAADFVTMSHRLVPLLARFVPRQTRQLFRATGTRRRLHT